MKTSVKEQGICLVAVVQILHVQIEKLEYSRTADVVVRIQIDEHSIFVVEGDAELHGEASDDVGVEIRC